MENQENIVLLNEFLKEPLYWIEDRKQYRLCIVYHQEDAFMPGEVEERLLNNILKAIKIPRKEVQWINTAFLKKEELELKDIKSDYILCFGSDLNYWQPSSPWPSNQLIEYKNKKMILTDALFPLEKDTQQKKELWTAMKEMFGF